MTEAFSQIDIPGDILDTLGAKLGQVGHFASDLLLVRDIKGNYGTGVGS